MPGLKVELTPVSGITPPASLAATMVFQCPPTDQFEVQYAFSHTDYETMDNQYSHKDVAQLTVVSFDTLTIDYAIIGGAGRDLGTDLSLDSPQFGGSALLPSWAGTTDLPEQVTEILVTLNQSGDPFLFTASYALPTSGFTGWGTALAGPEIQMYATLRTVSVTEKAGEPDARYYSLGFTEYRLPIISSSGAKQRPGSKTISSAVTIGADGVAYSVRTVSVPGKGGKIRYVQVRDAPISVANPAKGVTLASIATQVYGDPSYAKIIALANGLSIGNDQPLTDLPQFANVNGANPPSIKMPDPKTAALAQRVLLATPNGSTTNATTVLNTVASTPTVVSKTRQD